MIPPESKRKVKDREKEEVKQGAATSSHSSSSSQAAGQTSTTASGGTSRTVITSSSRSQQMSDVPIISKNILTSSSQVMDGGRDREDHRERGELRSEVMSSGSSKVGGSSASNRRDRDHYDNRKEITKSPPHVRGTDSSGSSQLAGFKRPRDFKDTREGRDRSPNTKEIDNLQPP